VTITKVVIPVAGIGTRLLPVTKSQPKEMLPVGRKPVVQYVIEEALGAGLHEALFITGRQKSSIEDHFDADPDLVHRLHASGKSDLVEELAFLETRATFFYVRQNEPKGLADAVRYSRSFVGTDHFVVSLGDSIIKGAEGPPLMRRMIAAHQSAKADCTIGVERVPDSEVHQYGIIEPDGEPGDVFRAKDMIEKPTAAQTDSRMAIAARYILGPRIFDAIERTVPDRNGELQLTDAIRILIKEGYNVQAVQLGEGERRYDIGNFESYFRTFVDFALDDERYGYMLRQHLSRTRGL